MHINVRNFLAETVGYTQAYSILGERPSLDGVRLTEDIQGDITIAKLPEPSVLVDGQVQTVILLECHRCLRSFTRPVQVKFKQIFAKTPIDDNQPIIDGQIDLAPLIGQEIILSLPVKILDRPDCPGLQVSAESDHQAHPAGSLGQRARIITER